MVDDKPKPMSRSDVVDAIRKRILRGDLVPGQRLIEAEICELLKVSRGTVRTALMDLAHEGLIERIANRGARVRVVSVEEALQIVEVRFAVESLVVARAAERISDEEIKTLRELAKQLKARAEENDIEGFAEVTFKIIETNMAIAKQPVATEILTRLRARNMRHRYRLTYRPGRAQVALPYWLDLLDAICARDPEKAKAALSRHVRNIEEAMKALAPENTPFAVIYPNAG